MSRIAAALLAFVLVGTAPALAAPRQPAGEPRSVSLAGRSPWVGPDGVLRLDLATEGDAGPLRIGLTVHAAVDSVEELQDSLEGDTGSVLYRMPVPLAVGHLPTQADGTRRLELSVSPSRSEQFTARLRRPGVYPVTVTFEDDTGDAVSTIHTPLVRLGTDDQPLPAPRLALLVELAADPSIEVEGRRELDERDIDRLARAAELVAAGGGRPLALSIDASPDTIDALTASADPRAAEILDALASTAGHRTALAAPYVSMDVPTLVAAGLGDFLTPALDAGRAVLDDRLGPEVDAELWDSPGGIDAPAAALLRSVGVEHVVVDGEATAADDSPAAERTLIDAGPVPLPGIEGLEALVVDAATSEALAARAADRADAGHIALAELLLRADDTRTVAVRADDVADDSVLSRLLPLLADPSSPVEVGPLDPAAVTDEPDEDGSGPTPDELAELLPEPSSTEVPDLRAVADDVRFLSGSIGTFADLLGPESARADELRLRLLTSLASGIDTGRRRALVDAVATTIDSTFDGISITGQTDLNLTSRRGTLPLMVANRNPFPVEVVLRIRSDRLDFPEGDRFPLVVGEDVARVDVPVLARATGSVPTFVEIVTPDGGVVLDSRRLDVRSTAVSGVGLAISVGALLVLVVWWARTWRRNRATSKGAG